MSAHTPDYRPTIGQTLFMGFMDDQPYVVTVTGFHQDARFSSEQIEFTVGKDGKPHSSSINLYKFYPDAPIDSKYVYCVVQSSFDGRELLEVEESYFFSESSAFEFKAGLESGAIGSRLDLHDKDRTFRVQVEMV
ncbi:hypothetical protein P5706_36575 [Pseudomonas sp. ChxA]|jgi:hypothetical protein|uniref:hypothetical protein n=1 Tax=Pseudomonas TaxID=286 RepID=UPI0009964517|nr:MULTISPECIES: hypothetical protein [Pseudomonas]MBJ2202667.1 hypothetical protein [Pseudomonas carnis]MBX9405646.1 hypothetical protein [Pseudomonas baetica]MDL2189692.1 hypothetical protein [Pseudomonas sp. ChxA]OOW07099.1 hypothetical protein MF6394_02275 [Pseudomonas sp. MF6394]